MANSNIFTFSRLLDGEKQEAITEANRQKQLAIQSVRNTIANKPSKPPTSVYDIARTLTHQTVGGFRNAAGIATGKAPVSKPKPSPFDGNVREMAKSILNASLGSGNQSIRATTTPTNIPTAMQGLPDPRLRGAMQGYDYENPDGIGRSDVRASTAAGIAAQDYANRQSLGPELAPDAPAPSDETMRRLAEHQAFQNTMGPAVAGSILTALLPGLGAGLSAPLFARAGAALASKVPAAVGPTAAWLTEALGPMTVAGTIAAGQNAGLRAVAPGMMDSLAEAQSRHPVESILAGTAGFAPFFGVNSPGAIAASIKENPKVAVDLLKGYGLMAGTNVGMQAAETGGNVDLGKAALDAIPGMFLGQSRFSKTEPRITAGAKPTEKPMDPKFETLDRLITLAEHPSTQGTPEAAAAAERANAWAQAHGIVVKTGKDGTRTYRYGKNGGWRTKNANAQPSTETVPMGDQPGGSQEARSGVPEGPTPTGSRPADAQRQATTVQPPVEGQVETQAVTPPKADPNPYKFTKGETVVRDGTNFTVRIHTDGRPYIVSGKRRIFLDDPQTVTKLERPDRTAEQIVRQPYVPAPVEDHASASTALTPDGSKVQTVWRIVPRSSIVSSHEHTVGEPNPEYGAGTDLQPRDRADAAQMATIEEMARSLDPERWMLDQHSTDRGAPVVGPDGMVESGNGRVMALDKAKAQYPERYKAYVDALHAAHPESAGIVDPIMVQERITPMTPEQRVEFARKSNKSSSAVVRAGDVAKQDADTLPANIDSLLTMGSAKTLDEALKRGVNDAAVRGWLDKTFTPAELGDAYNTEGTGFSPAVRERFARALLVHALGKESVPVLNSIWVNDDFSIRIAGGLEQAVPSLLRLRAAANAGNEIAGEVLKAISDGMAESQHRRGSGLAVENYYGNGQLFGDAESSAGKLVGYALDGAKSKEQVASRLNAIATAAEDSGGGLFGEEASYNNATEAISAALGGLKAAEDNVVGGETTPPKPEPAQVPPEVLARAREIAQREIAARQEDLRTYDPTAHRYPDPMRPETNRREIGELSNENGPAWDMVIREATHQASLSTPKPEPVPTPTPPVPEPDPVHTSRLTFELPADLSGAKPRFGYKDRNFELEFQSDYDKAAYILARDAEGGSSKAAPRIIEALKAAGLDPQEAAVYGKQVSARIKGLAANAPAETKTLQVHAEVPRRKQTGGWGGRRKPKAPAPTPTYAPVFTGKPKPYPLTHRPLQVQAPGQPKNKSFFLKEAHDLAQKAILPILKDGVPFGWKQSFQTDYLISALLQSAPKLADVYMSHIQSAAGNKAALHLAFTEDLHKALTAHGLTKPEDFWKASVVMDTGHQSGNPAVDATARDVRFVLDRIRETVNGVRRAYGLDEIGNMQDYFMHYIQKSAIQELFGIRDLTVVGTPEATPRLAESSKPWAARSSKTRTGALQNYDLNLRSVVSQYADEMAYEASHIPAWKTIDVLRSLLREQISAKYPASSRKQYRNPDGSLHYKVVHHDYSHVPEWKRWNSMLDELTMIADGLARIAHPLDKTLPGLATVAKVLVRSGSMMSIFGNIGSGLVQLASLANLPSEVGPRYAVTGVLHGLARIPAPFNKIAWSGPITKSAFMAGRLKDPIWTDEKNIIRSAYQHGHDLARVMQGITDVLTWQACFDKASASGMPEAEAIAEADAMAARVLTTRGAGARARAFDSKILQALGAQFMEEQWGQMQKALVHMGLTPATRAARRGAYGPSRRKALWAIALMLAGAHVVNSAYKAILGYRPSMDPVGAWVDMVEGADKLPADERDKVLAVFGEIMGNLPYVGALKGAAGTAGADVGKLFGDDSPTKYGASRSLQIVGQILYVAAIAAGFGPHDPKGEAIARDRAISYGVKLLPAGSQANKTRRAVIEGSTNPRDYAFGPQYKPRFTTNRVKRPPKMSAN